MLAHTMPANVEAERAILGAILLDNSAYHESAEHLRAEDFSLDSHRRIYARMVELMGSSRPIDLITLVEELDRAKELQTIGDVGYVSSLLDGVPDRPSIEHYIHIVRDKALLRGLIHAANAAIARAAEHAEPAEDILNDAEATIFQLSEKRIGRGFVNVLEIVKDSYGSLDAFLQHLQRGQRVTGLATHYSKLDEMTSGLQKSDLIIIAARPSMGKTAFASTLPKTPPSGTARWWRFSRWKCPRRPCCSGWCVPPRAWTLTGSAPVHCGKTTLARCGALWTSWPMR